MFTDPYRFAELIRWTKPQLDDIAAEFRADAHVKIAVQQLKWMFLSRGEALLHGDLHTGSIMTSEQTRVIDPEFAVYGPMGFDLGAFMANLLLSNYSQDGHVAPGDDRKDYQRWVLDTLETFWRRFETKFFEFWRTGSTGDAFVPGLFEDEGGRRALEAYASPSWRVCCRTRSASPAPRWRGAFLVLPMSRTWNRSGIPAAERSANAVP